VFVLGANEGSFPASITDNSFFTDRDKIELETLQIDLSAKTDERGDDELLFFKNSISVASSTVTVTALKTNINGSKKEESIGFSRLRALLNGIKVIDIGTLDIVDKIYTKKMARELFGVANKELKQAISESCDDLTISDGSFVNENDKISEETAKVVFGKTLYLSKSKLEKFAKCRFDYYCSYVLSLRDNEKITFTHNDIGTLVHSVSEHFLKLDRAERKEYTDEEIYEIVTRLTDEYTLSLCGVRGLTNKMKHFFGRLKGTICVFVKSLLEEMRHSKFTPEFFEISINGNGVSSPLPLEFTVNDESSIIMTGIADRIDVCRTENTTYIKILDYKTGSYSFKLSGIDKGLDLQMLIYLMAICNMDESEFKKNLLKWTEKIEPAGIVYLTYKINKTDADKEIDLSSCEAIQNEENAIRGKISRSGLALDNDMLKSDDKQFDLSKGYVSRDELDDIFELVRASVVSIGVEMLKGGAQAQPLKSEDPCRYCKNGAICRRRVSE
jgi:ATP-dependent helicase/nuclease subunit B